VASAHFLSFLDKENSVNAVLKAEDNGVQRPHGCQRLGLNHRSNGVDLKDGKEAETGRGVEQEKC
jgi:hypothetical protein